MTPVKEVLVPSQPVVKVAVPTAVLSTKVEVALAIDPTATLKPLTSNLLVPVKVTAEQLPKAVVLPALSVPALTVVAPV